MINLSAIEGILFDKDGTLIELDPMWLPTWTDAADRLARVVGRPYFADVLLRRAGYDRTTGALKPNATLLLGTDRDILNVWKSALGKDAPPGLGPMLSKVFADASSRNPVPTTDLKSLFGRLHGEGYILGIATNDTTRKVRTMVDYLDIAHDLAFICGSDAGHGSKPDPDMALAFCEHTGVAAKNAAMVGDTIADALMAKAAGFGAVIGVRTGSTMTQDQERSFDTIIESVDDLPRLMNVGVHDM